MVEAITEMPKASDQHAVQPYLGMLNFLARFCPKLSDAVRPLRDLTHKDVPFKWTDAFVESKNLIAHADITVETDHQPLETIFKKPLYKAAQHLQAMHMRLQR